MKSKYLKFILIFLLLFVASYVYSQEVNLEVDYPGFAPESSIPLLPQVIKYIYTFVITVAGLIALGSLIMGGVMLLTSSGDPNKTSSAKKQILTSFLGVLILLSLYFILNIINPNLTRIDLPVLSPLENPLAPGSSFKTVAPNILERINKIAEKTKESIDELKRSSEKLKALTNKCDCERTQSLCVCIGKKENLSCEAVKAYSENIAQACPDGTEIKEKQKDIVAWKEELFYYKNRASAEANDLLLEIEKLNKEKDYYTKLSASIDDSELISYYKNKESELAKEIELNDSLAKELDNLAELIDKIGEPSIKLSMLPEKCLSSIGTICEPNCKGGCLDLLNGCEPEKPNKGNPCPMEDIEDQLRNIQESQLSISSIADQIINKVLEIINFKTIVI